MAKDPSSTSSLDEADWISATKLGENITQINYGAWIIAPGDIQETLLGGCGAVLELEQNGQKSYAIPPPGFWLPPDRLRWVNALNPSMRREEYPDRPWRWELRAYLSPGELWEVRHLDGSPIAREQVGPTLRVFLRRAGAAQWGLPLESPQAVASEEPPPREQPGESTVGSAGGEAAPASASAVDASAPVANTEASVAKPEPASPPSVSILEQNAETASSASAASSPAAPQAESVLPNAETGPEESPPSGKQPDELMVVNPTPGPETPSHNSARPPSDKDLGGFVAGFIKDASDAKEIPTKMRLYQLARGALPGATRQRLFDEFERQTETPPPGRPRKNR